LAVVRPALERLAFSRDPRHDDAVDATDEPAGPAKAAEKHKKKKRPGSAGQGAAEPKRSSAGQGDGNVETKSRSGGGDDDDDEHASGGDHDDGAYHAPNDNEDEEDEDDEDDNEGGGGRGDSDGGAPEVAEVPLPQLPILPAIVLCVCDDPEAHLTLEHFAALSSLLRGDVPDALFPKDDQKRLGLGLREAVLRQREAAALDAGGKRRTAQQRLEDPWRGLTEAQLQQLCWALFCARVKARLRVVVVLDPGDRFGRGSGSPLVAPSHHAHHRAAAGTEAAAGSEAGSPAPSEPNTARGGDGGGLCKGL
jgi:hypothetical protein